jgi:hypothetical protein
MSLDDMRKQDQSYFIGRNPYQSYSQEHMRRASAEEVNAYFAEQGRRKTAEQIIAKVQKAAAARRRKATPQPRATS